MKAKELLKEITKSYPDIVAITMDESGYIFFSKKQIPIIEDNYWVNKIREYYRFQFPNIVEWDFEDWRKCIVTINDLKDE